MPKYQIPFRKNVWGYFKGEAKNKKEALENYTDWDEFDNSSEYEIDIDNIVEIGE